MIVMKFGGTSTQDAAAIKNVVSIVSAHRHSKPVVVISAIAQATNVLEKAGKLASEGKAEEAVESLRKLIDRHIGIVDERIKDRQRRDSLLRSLSSALTELEDLVRGVTILRELTPRSMDAFYSYGELLSSRLVAAALQEEGVEAQWIDTKEFMVTDDAFTSASPMMEIVGQRLPAVALPLLSQGIVPVTQGFIGVTSSGRRTTMGRESSDYSAAVIGAALNAEDIQIWTDVDGVLTADPRVVTSPKKVKILSFDEAYELSFFGAKVLHPNTMLPAIEKNIPIHVYNSRRAQSSGTLVTTNSSSHRAVVKSVAYKRDVAIISIKPFKRLSQYVFWEHLYSILTKFGTNANLTASSEYSIVIALDAKTHVEAILHEMSALGSVNVLREKAILCLVGSNIKDSPGIMNRLFASLADANVAMISYGASASSVSLVIDDDEILDAVKNVHAAFFAERQEEEIFETLERAPAV